MPTHVEHPAGRASHDCDAELGFPFRPVLVASRIDENLNLVAFADSLEEIHAAFGYVCLLVILIRLLSAHAYVWLPGWRIARRLCLIRST